MTRFDKEGQSVLDRRTGLAWAENAALSEFPLSWSEALEFIRELNRSGFSGYNDWKLPHRRELFSLVSHRAKNPSLPPDHPFINVFTGYYWTATSCARLPDQAWYVHLGGARVFKGMKHGSYMVWPVRQAGADGEAVFQTGQKQCYDERGRIINCAGTGQDGEFQAGVPLLDHDRFSARSEIVHDNLTGLTWLKQADCHQGVLDWQSARNIVAAMNRDKTNGFDDWRLPEVVELESLTDMSQHSPALPPCHPFLNVREFYWSATTSHYDQSYAWVLYFQDGAVGVGHKPLAEFYLWPVRGRDAG